MKIISLLYTLLYCVVDQPTVLREKQSQLASYSRSYSVGRLGGHS